MDNYIMVTGIPNVGKSTFINGLRNWHYVKYGYAKHRGTKPTSVGPNAGVTRVVSHKILISDGPPRLFVLDSPGIWEPSKENLESVLKMALCGCLNFDSIDKEIIIDYLLYFLNKNGHLDYVHHYNMPDTTDNIIQFAQRICMAKGFVTRANKRVFGQDYAPNFDQAFLQAFKDFNSGALGRFSLDDFDQYDENAFLYRNRNTVPLGTIIRGNTPLQARFPFVWGSD